MTLKVKRKPADRTTSVRLPPITVRQIQALCEYTGENASKVVVRSVNVLYERHAEDIESKPKRKESSRGK